MTIISQSSPSLNNFECAGRAILQFLHERLGFDLWMVTRTECDDWIVLQVEERGYGIEADAVFRWTDSFCSRMVAGRGPCIAPKSDAVPAYAEAPIGRQLKIGSYVGVPLRCDNGSLFGTLCAIHPAPQPESITAELPLIELLAGMLSGLLNAELKEQTAIRQAERLVVEADTDVMTGLYNRRGWQRLVEAEEARCRRFGHPACIVVVDLDGLKAVNDSQGHAAGDQLIRGASEAISRAVRKADVVARTGGDEFAVMGVECNFASAQQLCDGIRVSLDRAKISVSIGVATRLISKGLTHAWQEADRAMYRYKERVGCSTPESLSRILSAQRPSESKTKRVVSADFFEEFQRRKRRLTSENSPGMSRPAVKPSHSS